MARATSMNLGAALVATLSLAAGPARADDACVPPQVSAALADCAVARAKLPAAPAAPGLASATSCYDPIARELATFTGTCCKDGKEKANAEACAALGKIESDILRLKAETLVKEGDAGGDAAAAAYEAAAATYQQIWEQHGRAACEAGGPGCLRMDEILSNVARAHQAAREIDKAIAIRKVLVDPRYHLDRSELARKAVYEIGGNYHALAMYAEAVPWYERFARQNPAHARAKEALSDAIVLRLGLGQSAEADADAADFLKAYGARSPAQAANIAFALAMHAVEQGRRDDARHRLEASMAMLDRSATVDLQIQAHAALGRVLAELGKGPAAAAEYRKVKDLYRDPEHVVASLRGVDESSQDRRLARALNAVGEATFFFAEEKRRAADAIAIPAYKGTGRREDFLAYTGGALASWFRQRRQAIDEAEKAYREVLLLQPVSPPKWVIAAAARVARMQGKLAAQIRSLPLPKIAIPPGPSPAERSWEAVIRGEWRGSLEQASEPFLARAKADYQLCLDRAVKYQYHDGYSQGCAAWLSSHYPAEYPRIDEIMDRPSHRFFGSAVDTPHLVGEPVP